MKKLNLFSFAGLALMLLISLGACKNPCKDNPCGEHGTCVEVDKDFSCNCDSGYEGDLCDTEMRTKFIGTFSVANTCDVGNPNSYSVGVTADGSDVEKVVFDNFFNDVTATNDIYGVVSGLNIEIPSQYLYYQNGDSSNYSGSGTYNETSSTYSISFTIVDKFGTLNCTDVYSAQ